MAFPETFLQDLKLRNDIPEVVSSYVTLKRRGRNMVGLCPFHGEKTPSFNIYAENGSFYCFGCGVGGDIITFVMKIENLDYMEAIKFLPQLGNRGAYLYQKMSDKLVEHKQYIHEVGLDLPEVANWKWED